MAKASCQICKIKDDTQSMIKEVNKKYYHVGGCHEEYIKERHFIEQENQKWCDLYEYLKLLHSVPDIPPRNISRLKRDLYSVKGYGFDLMLEAYKICEDKIKWFISDVLKGNSDAEGINKCITLMLNSGINSAWQNREKKRNQQELIQKQIEKKSDEDKDLKININNKNKTDDMDVTAFL